jgi:peptide/nickel transport system substrate-binding protein
MNPARPGLRRSNEEGSVRSVRLLVLATCLLFVACGKNSSDAPSHAGSTAPKETPVAGGTIIRHLESDCKTLNWVLYTTTYEDYVLRCLYDNLLDYDSDMKMIPVLAESYSVSKDHLRITVRLRDNLRWHDGVPITAEDVKFTMDKILDPAIPAVNKKSWFSKLDKVEVIDDKTVDFVWKEPYAPSIHALTQVAPIPKHIYGSGDFLTNPANRAPIGSGAFKFEEWKTGQSITLVRNDDYYAGKPYADRIIFRVIPDRGAALNALKIGELDEMRLRQIQWETQTTDPDFLAKFEKYSYYVPQYNYLAWNCRSTLFSDRRVRRAMTMLFDRKTVNEKIYSGAAQEISGPYYFKSWAYDPSVKPLPFDPQAAMKLLDEAGWVDTDGDGIREKNGVDFEFEFYIASGSQIGLDFGQLLQEECKKAGIKVKIRQLEGATFFDKVYNGEYDAAALAWRLDNDPDIYDTFHSSQVPPYGLNHTFYSNPTVDSLLEAGRVEFDQEKRAEIYHQVHRLIAEDQPYTFVNAVPEKRAISKRIGNVVFSDDGPFKFYPGAIYWFKKPDVTEAKQ